MSNIVVAALYQFTDLPDFKSLRDTLYELGQHVGLRGTLLLAQEGINGTVSGTREGIDALARFLHSDGRFQNLEYKESLTSKHPFFRLKVRVKKEIVTIGDPAVKPAQQVGTYVDPEDWNALVSDPDVLVVDTRNAYEVKIGTFQKAIDPKTNSFREFPEFVKNNLETQKKRKIAMFCTGGIRCEKASSFMLKEGFEEVYHLKGGVLKYLETIPPEQSLWEGDCFVFDQRVGLKHGLDKGEHGLCFGCRMPLSAEDIVAPQFEMGVSCPVCFEDLTESKKARLRQRQNQILLARARGTEHMGAIPAKIIYNQSLVI